MAEGVEHSHCTQQNPPPLQIRGEVQGVRLPLSKLAGAPKINALTLEWS